jgi:hypothetical protein
MGHTDRLSKYRSNVPLSRIDARSSGRHISRFSRN